MVDSKPTQAGFTTFIRNVMGINATILPDDDPVIPAALTISEEIVNQVLACLSPILYTLAVYNLGADGIINYAQDQPDAPVYKNDLPFFAYMRSSMNINGFVGGVIQSSGDEGTNESMVVPEAMKNFTMANLQQLKTPWGRAYMSIAQSYGPNVWALS